MAQNIQDMIVFVLTAIDALRDLSKSPGVHSRFSGLSGAFQTQFGTPLYRVESDARGKFIRMIGPLADMVASGAVYARPCRSGGGYMLYSGKDHAEYTARAEAERKAKAAADSAALASRISALAAGKRSGAAAGK